MNAVIYCRVSGTKQVNEGHGLESQEKRCKDWCKNNEYTVDKIFRDEGVTGSIGDRPAVRDMLEYLSQNPHTVVVIDDIKRLARDVKVFLLLKESIQSLNCTIHYLNHSFEDSPEGQFIQTILAGAAQLERQQNARQTKQKMKARLEEGYWVFSVPVGYQYSAGKRNKMLVKSEANPVVKEGLEKLHAGILRSVQEYYLFLKERLPKIARNRIYQSVQDIKYAGYLEHPKWGVPLTKAKHEATISLEMFNEIQEKLTKKIYINQKSKLEKDFPLRGFVSCAYCNRNLTAYWSKGKKNYFAYYTCQNPVCEVKHKTIPKDKLESEFLELLKHAKPSRKTINWATRIFMSMWDDYLQEAKKAKKDLERELELIKEAQKQVIEKFTKTSSDILAKAMEIKLEELEKSKLQLQYKLESSEDHPSDLRTPLDSVLKFIKNADKIWSNSSTDEQKILFNLVFKSTLGYDLNSGYRTPHFSSLYSAFLGSSNLQNQNGALMRTDFEHLVKVVFNFADAIKLLTP